MKTFGSRVSVSEGGVMAAVAERALLWNVFCFVDPIKTAHGSLSLKAYRLTPRLMEICKEKDFSPEG